MFQSQSDSGHFTAEQLLREFDGPTPSTPTTDPSPDLNDTFVNEAQKHGLVLILGAGVPTGDDKDRPVVPLWPDLLRGMACKHLGGNEIFDELQKTHSLPAIAGILEDTINATRDGSFIDALREELYTNSKLLNLQINRSELVAKVRALGLTTLCAVAAFCAVRDDSELPKDPYQPNSRVKAVITFNADTILQRYANTRYPDERNVAREQRTRIFRTIEREAAGPGRGINVYHMHGSLEFERDKIDNLEDESPDKIVFTEHQYFEFFNRPTSRFNYTFLFLLREYPCLFIGCSMMDDNIRRLLHYSKSQIAESYATEIIFSLKNSPVSHDKLKRKIKHAQEKLHRHSVILKRSDSTVKGLNVYDQVRARALYRLGVEVCWINEYSQIPDVLHKLYEQGDKDQGKSNNKSWRDVFP